MTGFFCDLFHVIASDSVAIPDEQIEYEERSCIVRDCHAALAMTWCEKDCFAIHDGTRREKLTRSPFTTNKIFPIKKAFPNKNPERPFAISNTFPL